MKKLNLEKEIIKEIPSKNINYLEENKEIISIIMLIFLINNCTYIEIFENICLNSFLNIFFGIFEIILFYILLFQRKYLSIKNKFFKTIIIILLIMGIIESFYHIGYGLGILLGSL